MYIKLLVKQNLISVLAVFPISVTNTCFLHYFLMRCPFTWIFDHERKETRAEVRVAVMSGVHCQNYYCPLEGVIYALESQYKLTLLLLYWITCFLIHIVSSTHNKPPSYKLKYWLNWPIVDVLTPSSTVYQSKFNLRLHHKTSVKHAWPIRSQTRNMRLCLIACVPCVFRIRRNINKESTLPNEDPSNPFNVLDYSIYVSV